VCRCSDVKDVHGTAFLLHLNHSRGMYYNYDKYHDDDDASAIIM